MLEDFMPKNDKPTTSGSDGQPEPTQKSNNQIIPPTTSPAGPYRPSILNQQSSQVVGSTDQQADSGATLKAEAQSSDITKSSNQVNSSDSSTVKKKSVIKSKKIISIIVLAIVITGGFIYWLLTLNNANNEVPTSQNSSKQTPEKIEEVSKLVRAALSGLEVEKNIANRPVTAIMIENSGEARPQSGLMEADLVFEAIAEGGITRFLAMYQSKSPEYIGPIRSARPYYVEWAKTFDASYVHAGGSPDGLQTITALGVKDISAFSYGDDVFFRTSDRQSPHNLYSSLRGLDKINSEKGFTSSKFDAWNRKQDVPQTPTAKNINITISSDYYNPSYTYDETTNTYLRSQGGETHKDEKSGKQLAPKTVLVMVMNRTQNGIYSVYKTSGSGKFYAFQDGIATEGTWSRDNSTSQYNFKDANGFDYLFNKGQTWISVVSEASGVKFNP